MSHNTMKMDKFISTILIFTTVSGCSTLKTAIAMTQSTDHFIHYSGQSNSIYQEAIPSPLAENAKKHLDNAIVTVERTQFRKFTKPAAVYAVADLDSLERYCGWRRVLGCVVNQKIFLSPRILTQPDGTLPRLLTHELSHLHLVQQLSLFDMASIPVWFREGLAVYISSKSDGVSLEFTSAKSAMKNGDTFHPNDAGSLFFPKDHRSFGLSRSNFYRQTGSFIKYLADNDEENFKRLLLSIQNKQHFADLFIKYYGKPVKKKWKEFLENI